jgi:hypothetical protein
VTACEEPLVRFVGVDKTFDGQTLVASSSASTRL